MSFASIAAAGLTAGAGAAISNNQDTGGGGGDNLLSPRSIFSFLLTMVGGWEQDKAQKAAAAATDAQIAHALEVAQQVGPQALAAYNPGSQRAERELQGIRSRGRNDALGLYQGASRNRTDFLRDFNQRGDQLLEDQGAGLTSFLSGLSGEDAEIMQGYRDRYAKAEADIEGYGDQQKEDIDTGYRNKEAAITQDLISRGLSPTSVSAVNKTINETERSAEQRRLGEDLTRNRVNLLSGLSGDTLSAQERLGGRRAGYQFGGMQNAWATQGNLDASEAAYDAALRGDIQAARQFMAQSDATNSGNLASFYSTDASNRSTMSSNGLNTYLQTIMAPNYVPPPANPIFGFMQGQNTGGSPQYPSAGSSFLAGAAPGISQGFAQGLNNWFKPQQTQPWTGQTWQPDDYNMNQYYGQQAVPPSNTYSNPSTWSPAWDGAYYA